MLWRLLTLPARVVVWLCRRPMVSVPAVALDWLAGRHGIPTAAAGSLGLAALLAGWHRLAPGSFRRRVMLPLTGDWRRWCRYRHWSRVMLTCGLTTRNLDTTYVPHLATVVPTEHGERLAVGLPTGLTPDDVAKCGEALAHAFGAHACRVIDAGPGWVVLSVLRADSLGAVLPAVAIPAQVDLCAVRLGRCEDGTPWTLRLLGSHVLLAGATGAGKSSVLWGLLRGLAPAIHNGSVRVWAVDPKGGMELAPGLALFCRFAGDDPAGMAALLEDAVALMRERAGRLRGTTRLHQPSPGEPLVLVVVDEVAALTAYAADRDVRKRVSAALSTLLTQGRAVGVLVIAALQDPRKEVLPFRDLFPVRIGLRLIEAEQVGLVLGDGARDRGAACHRIPLGQPGVGYVLLDGRPEPVRVRAAQVTDEDIDALVRDYPAPVEPVVAEVASVVEAVS